LLDSLLQEMAGESSSRPQFGGRVLEKEGDVFKHNAWDNVEWGQKQQDEAQEMVDKATSVLMDAEKAQEFEDKAGLFWDKFYSVHQNRFFKERNWLFTEFPDLAPGYTGAVRVFQPGQVQQESGNDNDNLAGEDDKVAVTAVLNQAEVDETRKDESYFGSNANFRLLEIGCGTGSTVFPILEMNTSPNLMVYCCDLSTTAVQLVSGTHLFLRRAWMLSP